MAGSKGKKDAAYQALQDLMRKDSPEGAILADLFSTYSGDPKGDWADGLPMFSDYAVATVFSAMTEQALERALITHFVTPKERSDRLFSYVGTEGPLSTFSAKIALGEALGLFDERMRQDLVWIKHIRNAFAHARIPIDFSYNEIEQACKQIKVMKKVQAVAHGERYAKLSTPRYIFTAACAFFVKYLSQSGESPLRFVQNDLYATLYRD